jgi:hypothetical protein
VTAIHAENHSSAEQQSAAPAETHPAAALTRDRALGLVQGLVSDGIISGTELRPFVPESIDPFDPEALRQEYERWFRAAGVEWVTGREFSLGPCPFRRDELTAAAKDGWIPVVSPKGLTISECADTFHFPTWAASDPLVTSPAEEEDLWFMTPGRLAPDDANVPARELRARYDKKGLLGMSLQRYMIVAARLRHLTGEIPDFRWWTWILRGRYDRSGFMIAGFDPNRRFSVHAWMPSFHTSFVGSRPIRICPRIAGPGSRPAD